MNSDWDCIVVGGGAAGLSAALVLGRARRRTLLIDAGTQSNLAAHGIGGLLGHDGRPPAELYALGRKELAAYPSVEVRTGEVLTGERTNDGLVVELADGRREATRRILLATGMEYRPPALPGLRELWGRSVFHCPFCHGWEVRDQPLGVLARGERAVHSAVLLRAWSDDVILLTDGPDDFDDDQCARLAAANVAIDRRAVTELVSRDGELEAVVFDDGSRLARSGLLVATTLHQRSPLAEQLGARIAEPTPIAQNPVAVDALYRTTAPGVFAAG
ncbi:MAG TPA: NAD(P)/FAD-dependent oxidoreductase, partial [Mycobacterium sp.]|nr:NAD(P)/FAD-dependent oxidoreductase [Mycobacterium sp.]